MVSNPTTRSTTAQRGSGWARGRIGTEVALSNPGEGSITLTLSAAAGLLGISETLARQMAREGRFPGAFQLGRVWRVHRQTFDEQVARLARGQPLEHEEDRILSRAFDEVRLRHGSSFGR